MEARLERVFISEVETQCHFILLSAHQLQHTMNEPPLPGSTHLIWRELQTILISSANISKLLWGSEGRFESERAELRADLNVPDDSPLRSPDLRNDFEHFDERILSWAETEGSHNIYLGRSIAPKGKMIAFGDGRTDADFPHFGLFDPDANAVWFWDHEVALNPIITAAQSILDAIATIRERPPGR